MEPSALLLKSIEQIENHFYYDNLSAKQLRVINNKVKEPNTATVILVRDMKVFNYDTEFQKDMDWYVPEHERKNGYSANIYNMLIYVRELQPENVVSIFSFSLRGIHRVEHILLKGN